MKARYDARHGAHALFRGGRDRPHDPVFAPDHVHRHGPSDLAVDRRFIRAWARALVRAAGIDLQVENVERIDPDKRYILVANHYSYLDIPCIFAAIPQPIRFMAKVSLFKIPIFGWALGRAGFIPIDRKNRRTAVKSFDLAADRIRKGNTIVIFPEEGRTRERKMRPFQRGAFLLAIKSEQTDRPGRHRQHVRRLPGGATGA